VTDNTCYYNGSDGNSCRYFVNLKCYPYVDSSYTASTCANIGGFFATSDIHGEPGGGTFCYYKQFNCSLYHSADGQCYRHKTPVNAPSECDSNAGYYKHGFCYYECPNSKYVVDDRCYDHRSTNYTPSDCRTVGGSYAEGYCYINACSYFSANGNCYRYKTASYTNRTCSAIGGHYALEETGHAYCYHTSFACPHHTINGQCYSRSGNQSETLCSTIPDSYFDDISNTCYYHCTEIPMLQGRYLIYIL